MSTSCTPLPDCTCAPGTDQEIIFNEATCLSTDSRFLWDYTAGLLSVDGAMAASGYIASSSQVEGSFLSMQALGTGSFNFTPTSGFGGLVYRGGSVFYYWNNSTNTWDSIDFAGEVVSSQINVSHNGTLLGAFSALDFVDNSAGVWSLTAAGEIQIALSTTWTSNVNAAGFALTNLASINGTPMSDFLFNALNQSIIANNNNITGVNNLTTNFATVNTILNVNSEMYYRGVALEQLLAQELWSVNADGSIYRNSNVTVTGSYSASTKLGPFNVSSTNNSNFLFLNTTGSGADEFAAFAVSFDNTYGGELGFSQAGVELWTGTQQLFQAYADGHFYFPGRIGLGVNPPNYTLDMQGSLNVSSCIYLGTVQFACSAGAAGVNLTNIININGIATASFAQTPWLSAINGNGYPLNGAGPISTNGISVNGSINISGNYLVNNVPINTGGQNQSPWQQDVLGANFALGGVSSIGIGVGSSSTPTPSPIALDIIGSYSGNLIACVNNNQTRDANIFFQNSGSAATLSVGIKGTGAAFESGQPNINFTGNNPALTITLNGNELMRFMYTAGGQPQIGINQSGPGYQLDVGGFINASSGYYLNNVPFAALASANTVSFSNVSTINGIVPSANGPTVLVDQTANRPITGGPYHNTSGKVIYANVVFNLPASTNAAVDIIMSPDNATWHTVAVANLYNSAGPTEKTLSFIVLNGWYYYASPAGAVTLVSWFEWS